MTDQLSLLPMAAVAQATTHTHFIYHFQPPEGKVCTERNNHLTKSIPALDESPRGYYTMSRAKVVRPLHQ